MYEYKSKKILEFLILENLNNQEFEELIRWLENYKHKFEFSVANKIVNQVKLIKDSASKSPLVKSQYRYDYKEVLKAIEHRAMKPAWHVEFSAAERRVFYDCDEKEKESVEKCVAELNKIQETLLNVEKTMNLNFLLRKKTTIEEMLSNLTFENMSSIPKLYDGLLSDIETSRSF